MDIEDRIGVLEQRVAELEARSEIQALAVRYGEVVDSEDVEGLRRLFTTDAVWRWANGVIEARGIDEIIDLLAGRTSTIDASLHVVEGHRVDLDAVDPDRATGVLFSHAEVLRSGTPMLSALRYDDEYRSQDGTWRFASRSLSFFYYVEVADYATEVTSPTPVRTGTGAVAADLRRPR